jgi:hypothetical protein
LSLIATNVLDWTLRLELKEDGRSGLLDSDATLGTSELTLGTVMVEVGQVKLGAAPHTPAGHENSNDAMLMQERMSPILWLEMADAHRRDVRHKLCLGLRFLPMDLPGTSH